MHHSGENIQVSYAMLCGHSILQTVHVDFVRFLRLVSHILDSTQAADLSTKSSIDRDPAVTRVALFDVLHDVCASEVM
jgi:hypothetical protein